MDSLTISWTRPEIGGNAFRDVAEYYVEWNSLDGEESGAKTVNGLSTTLVKLTANTEYSIQLAARNEKNGANGEFARFENAITGE